MARVMARSVLAAALLLPAAVLAAPKPTPLPAPAVAPTPPPSVRAGVDLWRAGDWAGAVAIWQPFAAAGDPDAMFNLGQAYKLGRAVPMDKAIARDWYRKAAVKNHLPAEANLGILLFQAGEKAEAARWLKAAADRNEMRAQYVLGVAHWNGDGVPRSLPLAYAYLARASAQGLAEATSALGNLTRTIAPAERANGWAIASSLAAGNGIPAAYAPAAAPMTAAELNRMNLEAAQRPLPPAARPGEAAPPVAAGPATVSPTTLPPVVKPVPGPAPAPQRPVVLAQANPAPSPPVTTLPAQAKSDVGAPAPLPPGPTTPAPAKPVVVPVAPPKPVVVPAPAAPQVLVTTPPPSGRPAAPEVRTIELPPPPKPAPPAVVVAAPAAKAVAKAGDAAKSAAPLPTKVASKPAEKKPVEPTGWRVQLGAFGKRTQAEDAWTEVKTKQKAAVGNAKPIYESGASIVKLQIGPYKTRAEAKDACAKIAFSGRACFVTEAGS